MDEILSIIETILKLISYIVTINTSDIEEYVDYLNEYFVDKHNIFIVAILIGFVMGLLVGYKNNLNMF